MNTTAPHLPRTGAVGLRRHPRITVRTSHTGTWLRQLFSWPYDELPGTDPIASPSQLALRPHPGVHDLHR